MAPRSSPAKTALKLVEHAARTGVVSPLLEISGRRWAASPPDYWLLDAGGAVVKRFQVTTSSLDVDLSATLFVVEDGRLMRICVRETWRIGTTKRESVELAGLTPVDDERTDALVRAAIEGP